MTNDAVVVTRDDQAAVATVRMNRPDRRNALTTELKVALRDALEDVGQDPQVRAVVLSAAGPAFCVGQDLGEPGDVSVAVNAEQRSPLFLGAVLDLGKDRVVAGEDAALEAFLELFETAHSAAAT